jgi:hypothetical protein
VKFGLALLVVVTLVGCGGSPGGTKPPVIAASTSGPSSVPTTFGGIAGKAEKVACLSDAQLVQQASDLFATTHGHPAASMAELVAAGNLRETPSDTHGYVITYDRATGKVTASGVCTFAG